MRILFCTKKDVFGTWILNWVLPKLSQHHVKVLLSDKTRTEENSVQALTEEKFLERDLPLAALFPLIDSHSEMGPLATFEGCQKRYQVEIDTITSVNDSDTEKMIRDWAPDIIVSARFSLIFKANIESIPPLGIFNIHPGALPGYAGLCAPLRGILHAEKQLGCTLHKVDGGIDTGPIYRVAYLESDPKQSVFAHIAPLYELGLTNLLQLLADLAEGMTPQLKMQDKESFRYFRLPDEAAFAKLKTLGVDQVAVDVYSDFIKQFVPSALMQKLSSELAPQALRQLTQQVKSTGTDHAVADFADRLQRFNS
jgi:folate-dependent phosphoribosylglycinamide formyltransferase PurN